MDETTTPFLVKRQKEHLVEGAFTSKTPTLLSLDGGGLRGIISAEVLKSLEDSIKQVLWKNRLIRKKTVEEFLARAVHLKNINTKQKEDFLASYDKNHESTFAVPQHEPQGETAEAQFMEKLRTVIAAQWITLMDPSDWSDLKKCFDIDIADYFDQLAGTSTGGLLALYMASRGGTVKDPSATREMTKARPGSAAAMVDFYTANGKRIFNSGTCTGYWNLITTTGKYKHKADGLEHVLTEFLGDGTLRDLDKHHANVVITTVDASRARSGFFFHSSSQTPPAYRAPDHQANGSASPQATYGFATQLRNGDRDIDVLVRAKRTQDEADGENAGAIGWLNLLPTNYDSNQGRLSASLLKAFGGWVSPMHADVRNFRLVDVARATSAAPAFLPAKQLWPVDNDGKPLGGDQLPEAWKDGRWFLDGGLGNNDPVLMGLAHMLQRNNNASLKDCAILSIGTGTKAVFSGLEGKMPLIGIPEFVGDLVSLAMEVNGEDKEHFLNTILYGLLRQPDGTYLRIQLKEQPGSKKPGKVSHHVSEPDATQIDNLLALKYSEEKDSGRRDRWLAALQKMDDPSPDTLQAYKEIGEALGESFKCLLVWWVRCFVFGLENPATTPYVLGLRDLVKKTQDGPKVEIPQEILQLVISHPSLAATPEPCAPETPSTRMAMAEATPAVTRR